MRGEVSLPFLCSHPEQMTGINSPGLTTDCRFLTARVAPVPVPFLAASDWWSRRCRFSRRCRSVLEHISSPSCGRLVYFARRVTCTSSSSSVVFAELRSNSTRQTSNCIHNAISAKSEQRPQRAGEVGGLWWWHVHQLSVRRGRAILCHDELHMEQTMVQRTILQPY